MRSVLRDMRNRFRLVPQTRARVVWLVAIAIAGCASVPRGELFRHPIANYSFEVVHGWRVATVADYASIGFIKRQLLELDEDGRRRFLDATAQSLQEFDIVLVSSQGAAVFVKSAASEGADIPAGYQLTVEDRQTLWAAFREMVRNLPHGGSQADPRLESAETVIYRTGTALRVEFSSQDAAGNRVRQVMVAFFGRAHGVGIFHLGTPENPREGLQEFDALLSTLRVY